MPIIYHSDITNEENSTTYVTSYGLAFTCEEYCYVYLLLRLRSVTLDLAQEQFQIIKTIQITETIPTRIILAGIVPGARYTAKERTSP